jgi:GNAT superfamily N-acetyltransferase
MNLERGAMTPGLLREQSFRRSPPEASYLVAEDDDGSLIAMANYSTYPVESTGSPSLFLRQVYVVPAWRREGVATHVMRAVAQVAVSLGCTVIVWQAPDANWEGTGLSVRLGAHADRSQSEFRLGPEQIARLAREGADTALFSP